LRPERQVLNVILLVYDSVRPDFLGCYGASESRTDGIDSLAERGVLFETVVSSSAWTLPSVAALVSGVWSHKLGLFRWEQPWPDDVRTLFHYFSAAGYDVASFVFDESYLFSRFPEAGVRGHSRNLEPICEFVKKRRREPFFLFLHSWRTHIPWTPQPSAQAWRAEVRRIQAMLRTGGEGAVAECRRLYADSIAAAANEEVPAILDALREGGREEETLLIFTSDHGESWAERARDRESITDNFALHGRYLYDESIKVPLVLVDGRGRWAGTRVPHQVRSVDLAPTVLDLCGIPYPPEGFDGLSLGPLITGAECGDRPAFSSTTDSVSGETLTVLTRMAYRTPPLKMIWSVAEGRRELYDIVEDPGETCDRYEELAGTAAARGMCVAISAELDKCRPFEGTEEELAKLKDQLRGLGYL